MDLPLLTRLSAPLKNPAYWSAFVKMSILNGVLSVVFVGALVASIDARRVETVTVVALSMALAGLCFAILEAVAIYATSLVHSQAQSTAPSRVFWRIYWVYGLSNGGAMLLGGVAGQLHWAMSVVGVAAAYVFLSPRIAKVIGAMP